MDALIQAQSQVPPLPAICINLDSRPEKWRDTQAAFEGTGIRLERFSAIRHKEGWKGCGASHLAVVRKAAAAGWPWVLIVEDDCEPGPGFAERWPAICQALWSSRAEGHWDIFLGGPTFVEGPAHIQKSGLLEIEHGLTTHFCVINAAAYSTILAWEPDRHGPIDFYYSNTLRIVAAPTPPHIAYQRPAASDIQGALTDYRDLFTNSERGLLRLAYSDRTRGVSIGLLVLSAGVLGWAWFVGGARGASRRG